MGVSLDGLGSKHDVDYFYNFLKHPEQTYGAKTMDHGAPPKDAAYVSPFRMRICMTWRFFCPS